MTTTLTATAQPIVITQYEALQNDIKIAQQEAQSVAFRYEDPRGNREARSYIYKLRQLRSTIDKARKEAKAYALDYGKRVDAMAKELEQQLTALIEPHETEIKRIEEAEARRVAGHRAEIDRIIAMREPRPGGESIYYRQCYDNVKAIDTSGMEEFKAEADAEKLASLEALEGLFVAASQAEAEAAELARLRAEAAAREQAEREERIRQEAASAERQRAAQREQEQARAVAAAQEAERQAHARALAAEQQAAEQQAAQAERKRAAAAAAERAAAAQQERRGQLIEAIATAMTGMTRLQIAEAIVAGDLHPSIQIDWLQS